MSAVGWKHERERRNTKKTKRKYQTTVITPFPTLIGGRRTARWTSTTRSHDKELCRLPGRETSPTISEVWHDATNPPNSDGMSTPTVFLEGEQIRSTKNARLSSRDDSGYPGRPEQPFTTTTSADSTPTVSLWVRVTYPVRVTRLQSRNDIVHGWYHNISETTSTGSSCCKLLTDGTDWGSYQTSWMDGNATTRKWPHGWQTRDTARSIITSLAATQSFPGDLALLCGCFYVLAFMCSILCWLP